MENGILAKMFFESLNEDHGFSLTVIEGKDFGKVFLLKKGETRIGSSDSADIYLDDEKASQEDLKIALIKRHQQADIKYSVVITEINSSNGIFVNDIQITRQELKDGDRIKVGDTILILEISNSRINKLSDLNRTTRD